MSPLRRSSYCSSSRRERHEVRLAAWNAFEEYERAAARRFNNVQTHLAAEVRRRLAQCKWIESQLEAAETRLTSLAQGAVRPSAAEVALPEHARKLMFKIELLSETHYLIAWRASECLGSLPGLRSFCAVGVRNVRNRLIEHPDKKGGVYEWSTTYVSGMGLKIKPSPDHSGQPRHLDKGLWNNVMEFYVEFLKRMT